ncbi:hypothetical protein PMAYCL1PPCAC_01748, partial [Pristionchus mayeri]
TGHRIPRPSAPPVFNFPKTKLMILEDLIVAWGGLTYCLVVVCTVTYYARFIACPGVFGDDYCSDFNLLAIFLVAETMGNLGAFFYFRSENRVEHWKRHSMVASQYRTGEQNGGSSEADGKGEEREKN